MGQTWYFDWKEENLKKKKKEKKNDNNVTKKPSSGSLSDWQSTVEEMLFTAEVGRFSMQRQKMLVQHSMRPVQSKTRAMTKN